MSEENVEIIRRAYEQWQRGGETPDAVPVELYADDVEWDISGYPTVVPAARERRRRRDTA